MRKLLFIFVITSIVNSILFASFENSKKKLLNDVQLPFILNEGQYGESILYYAPIMTGSVFVKESGEVEYKFIRNGSSTSINLVENFINSDNNTYVGKSKHSASINYFIGSNENKWNRNATAYRSVSLKDVYPGVDYELVARNRGVEKIYKIHPGSDPCDIIAVFNNIKKLSIDSKDQLVVETNEGEVKFTKPIAYQIYNGRRHYIDVKYTIDNNSFSFQLGDYDNNKLLVIDPMIASTYFGGSNLDGRYYSNVDLKIDGEGNIYIIGTTSSPNLPTTLNAYDDSFNSNLDIFIAKFNSSLRTLMASTFIGGSMGEEARDGVFDDEGNLLITGYTASIDFPITPSIFQQNYAGGYGSTYGIGDAFILRITNDLSTLVTSTYIGGEKDDFANKIAIDNSGNIIITGGTTSDDFPVSWNGYDRSKYGFANQTDTDGFVAKLDDDLATLIAATYIGNNYDQYFNGILVGSDNSIYTAGITGTMYYPVTENAYDDSWNDETYRGGDAVISKLDTDLSTLIASTYLGGSGWDIITDMEFDNSGNIVVIGRTKSYDFPTTVGAMSNNLHGEYDEIFISKLDPSLSSLLASTYLGGTGFDNAWDFFITNDNSIYITGTTTSADFPVFENSYQKTYMGSSIETELGDIFVTKINAEFSEILASTFIGGSYADGAGGVMLDPSGNVVVAGCTYSVDYPSTSDSYCQYLNWNYDVVVSVLDPDLTADPTSVDNREVPNEKFVLYPNYPNPFNPSTTIRFDLSKEMNVSVEIYNSNGEVVKTLVDRVNLSAGQHSFVWTGRNNNEVELSSGNYFVRLSANGHVESMKLTLLK